MGIFNKMKEPVFLKEDSNAELQLTHLQELEPLLNLEGKSKIRQDIKYLEYGISMPKSKEELQMVSGFGEVKTNKYGDDILVIVNRY